MNNVIDNLNAFCSELGREFPLLNHGGCCLFASLIGAKLDAYGYNPRSIVFGDWDNDGPSIDEARDNVNNHGSNWRAEGINFSHVVVEFDVDGDTFLYDGLVGVIPQESILPWAAPPYNGRMTVEDTALAYEQGHWNSIFDHERRYELEAMVDSLVL